MRRSAESQKHSRSPLASRSEALMVAAGFNPRMTVTHTIWRRVATQGALERTPPFNRRSVTAGANSAVNRGLKPTATFISSLRDEGSLGFIGSRIGPREGRRRTAAFTLVELLVVMAIIALLATIGLPALKGFGKGNADAAAQRQMMDDIALARLRAISGRTTVYMVFVPARIGAQLSSLTDDRQKRQLTNLVTGQYSAYALFARRSVGAQPGRQNPRYLTEWKRLPDGILIATNKFDATLSAHPDEYRRSFSTNSFPFPSATSPERLLPYIAFNSQGQLIPNPNAVPRDELIPLARGSIFFPRTTNGLELARDPDVVISPVNNYTNNYIRINWLTGRASVDEFTRPKIGG